MVTVSFQTPSQTGGGKAVKDMIASVYHAYDYR